MKTGHHKMAATRHERAPLHLSPRQFDRLRNNIIFSLLAAILAFSLAYTYSHGNIAISLPGGIVAAFIVFFAVRASQHRRT